MSLEVKIKKLHPDAVIPQYARFGDAGLDITAIDDGTVSRDAMGMLKTYRTGIAVEIPEGHVGLIFPRSSIYKSGLRLTNCVGVIDSGYRGEILAKFDILSIHAKQVYKKGDRIAQLVILPFPQVTFKEVEELGDSERGQGGFGSTNVEIKEEDTQSS